jgi:uncharacterized protein with HEPN domain
MTDEAAKRLRDALNACRAIATFTAGMDFAAYEASHLVRSAVERQLEVVGEALRRAEDEDAALIERLPDLRRIVGIRNRIIHGYDAVDDEIVWDVVQSKAPALAADLTALLKEVTGDLGDES